MDWQRESERDRARSSKPYGRYRTAMAFTQHCAGHDIHAFYVSTPWLHLRAEVLRDDHHECQLCKARGRHTRANHVHHVNHVKQHPELALCKVYQDQTDEYKRNLISVCWVCHQVDCHPEKAKIRQPITKERW